MTNKYNLKPGLLITALLAGVLLYPGLIFAQSEELQDALEDVNQSVEKIDGAESEELANPKEIAPEAMTLSTDAVEEPQEDELVAKKEALENVLSFSILEVEEVREKLNQIKGNSKDTKN